MIRGTTPTFTLTLRDEEVDLTQAENVYVTFTQVSQEYEPASITKTGDDLTIEAKKIHVYISQEESLKFKEGMLDIQANWTYEDGKRACSEIKRICVKQNLLGEILQ